MKPTVWPLTLMLAACQAIPADPEDTTEGVRTSGTIRVGIDADDPAARALIAELAREARARPRIRTAPLEPLLADLERGALDVVVARFAHPSPWETHVTLAPPVASTGQDDTQIDVRAAMRNGENRWIMLVERASRRVAKARGK